MTKYLNWSKYKTLISQKEELLFMNDVMKENLRNIKNFFTIKIKRFNLFKFIKNGIKN